MTARLPNYTAASGEQHLEGHVLLVDEDGAPLLVTGDTLGSNKAVHVALLDGSGNQITSFSGTQYTEGDTDASITGTALMLEGAANALAAAIGGAGAVSAQVQRVTLGSDDPAVASLAVIEDWDESDRAKVNPIVGQAGVQGASGTVTALTQRVVLATDVALPAGSNSIGGAFPRPETSGGLTIARDIDLDNGTLTVVKASAGQVYGWDITNTTTATVFVKFYDATSGTLGTGTPVLTIAIPGNASDDTLHTKNFGGQGLTFATGICVGAGTGVADADNTDPGANGVVANIYYK